MSDRNRPKGLLCALSAFTGDVPIGIDAVLRPLSNPVIGIRSAVCNVCLPAGAIQPASVFLDLLEWRGRLPGTRPVRP